MNFHCCFPQKGQKDKWLFGIEIVKFACRASGVVTTYSILYSAIFAEQSPLYKLLSMKLSLWINKVVIEKLSYSLPVAINAVAGITDYQPNQIRSVNFLSWKAQNACIDSLWSSYQMKSLLKACWNEQVKNLLELNTLNIKCRVFPLTWSMSMIFNQNKRKP